MISRTHLQYQAVPAKCLAAAIRMTNTCVPTLSAANPSSPQSASIDTANVRLNEKAVSTVKRVLPTRETLSVMSSQSMGRSYRPEDILVQPKVQVVNIKPADVSMCFRGMLGAGDMSESSGKSRSTAMIENHSNEKARFKLSVMGKSIV